MYLCLCLFFFSSRRRHTRSLCDWSSDVCSSDLNSNPPEDFDTGGEIYKVKLDGTVIGKFGKAGKRPKEFGSVNSLDCRSENSRSEERRVGKECRSRWSPAH